MLPTFSSSEKKDQSIIQMLFNNSKAKKNKTVPVSEKAPKSSISKHLKAVAATETISEKPAKSSISKHLKAVIAAKATPTPTPTPTSTSTSTSTPTDELYTPRGFINPKKFPEERLIPKKDVCQREEIDLSCIRKNLLSAFDIADFDQILSQDDFISVEKTPLDDCHTAAIRDQNKKQCSSENPCNGFLGPFCPINLTWSEIHCFNSMAVSHFGIDYDITDNTYYTFYDDRLLDAITCEGLPFTSLVVDMNDHTSIRCFLNLFITDAGKNFLYRAFKDQISWNNLNKLCRGIHVKKDLLDVYDDELDEYYCLVFYYYQVLRMFGCFELVTPLVKPRILFVNFGRFPQFFMVDECYIYLWHWCLKMMCKGFIPRWYKIFNYKTKKLLCKEVIPICTQIFTHSFDDSLIPLKKALRKISETNKDYILRNTDSFRTCVVDVSRLVLNSKHFLDPIALCPTKVAYFKYYQSCYMAMTAIGTWRFNEVATTIINTSTQDRIILLPARFVVPDLFKYYRNTKTKKMKPEVWKTLLE